MFNSKKYNIFEKSLFYVFCIFVSALIICINMRGVFAQQAYASPPSDLNDIMFEHVNWAALEQYSEKSKSKVLDIELSEEQTDEYGNVIGGRVLNNWEHPYVLVPGHKYVQDPQIDVKIGSAPCELFVFVEDVLVQNEFGESVEANPTVAQQLNNNGWYEIPIQSETGKLYKYNKIVDGEAQGQKVGVSENFRVKANPTQETLDGLGDRNHHNTFTAYAYGVGCQDESGSYAPQTGDQLFYIIIAILIILLILVLALYFYMLWKKKKQEKINANVANV